MLILLLLYVIFMVVVAGLSSGFGSHSFIRRLPPPFITLSSLLVSIVLLLTFNRLDSHSIWEPFQWQLPFARLQVGIDPLSGFFLFPLLVLILSSATYGLSYLRGHDAGRLHWFYFSLLTGGMVVVLIARNALLFILAWEIMALASFLLVITDQQKPAAIQAGWIYFVTTHIGLAFLLALFFLLGQISGGLDFAGWSGVTFTTRQANWLFILALTAFGLKAGFIPFHIWLPLAHPAAPSHVSALMSGIMIKMGIYGLLRVCLIIQPFQTWWGVLLIVLGGISGILGVLFAIGQHDLKRLLAYHSVENIGIILIGLGLGMIGITHGQPTIAVLGFAGGLLHIANHALFKALLFMGAGAVIRQTGSAAIDRLGGLIKFMPRTALLFGVGSAAICGLPFFNGFISELFIYAAGLAGATGSGTQLTLICLAAILMLALIGGLAVACFTKVFGIVFLGEPRQPLDPVPSEAPSGMRYAMTLLALLCLAIGLAGPLIMPILSKPVRFLTGPLPLLPLYSITRIVGLILGGLLGCFLMVAGLYRLIRRRPPIPAQTVTWDCGYSQPAPTMQYTASSFAAPITDHYRLPLQTHIACQKDSQLFPDQPWQFHSLVEDWFLSRIYAPLINTFDRIFASLRWFQSGKTGRYVLYIAVTLIVLIIWKFF